MADAQGRGGCGINQCFRLLPKPYAPPPTVNTLRLFFFFFGPSQRIFSLLALAAPVRSQTGIPTGPKHPNSCFFNALAVNKPAQNLHCWSFGRPFASTSNVMVSLPRSLEITRESSICLRQTALPVSTSAGP